MSTTISGEGNLAALPVLKTTQSGKDHVTATVICNDYHRDANGEWIRDGSQGYELIIYSETLRRSLMDTATYSGNIRITFTGELTVRQYTRRDGTVGTTHRVLVNTLGVSLRGQKITVEKKPGQPVQEPDIAPPDPWTSDDVE